MSAFATAMPDQQYAHGGETAVEVDHTPIVHAAVKALQGAHSDPESALHEFESTFGEGSTDGLRKHLFGGPDESDGKDKQTEGFLDDDSPGMDDTLEADGPRGPGSIALSGGEFIIPADVTGMLGDGNSAAGGQLLEKFVAYVRQMKTGSTEQAPPIGRELVGNFLKHIDLGGDE